MSARDDHRDDPPRSFLALAGFSLAVVAALAAIASGPAYRWGVWELSTAFTVLKWAAYGGLASAVVSLVGVVATRVGTPSRGIALAMLGVVIGLVTAYVPWRWRQVAQEAPPIHDITTDTEDPPAFAVILPLRADAPNPSEYEGDSIARMQREAYPDVEPLVLDLPPDEAFDRALEAARAMGWEIHATRRPGGSGSPMAAPPGEELREGAAATADDAVEEPEEAAVAVRGPGAEPGRIEATDTTFWFGFEDDVVVRVEPADGGSRIDVRSVSRVGRGDVGTNAERIREYLGKLRGD